MTEPQLKSILSNPELPEWKEADEIVPNVWLGAITDNEQAIRRGITQVICVSNDPYADLRNEGFRASPHLYVIIFTIKSDTDGDLLSIFDELCGVINWMRTLDESVLVWDRGGGVAGVTAYIMQTYNLSLPEAMTVITRARLKRPKSTLLPSQRIIALLHNDNYLKQLEMWQACEFDIDINIITNPSEPRENWLIEKRPRTELGWLTNEEATLPEISDQPHRLSTITEIEEEAQHLSTSEESLD